MPKALARPAVPAARPSVACLASPRRRVPLRLAVGLSALALAGCSSSPSSGSDGGNSDGGGDMPNNSQTQVRLGHFVAGAPAFDVCVQGPADPGFTGPIVRTLSQHTGGVPYGYMSAYLPLPANTYSVLVVAGTRTDCSLALGGLPPIRLSPLSGGRHYTIGGMGDFSKLGTLKFQIIEDDLSPPSSGVKARFLNAVSGNSLDLGSGSASGFAPLFSNTAYGATADLGGGQQYLSAAAQVSGTYSLRTSGTSSDLVTFTNQVTLVSKEVYTLVSSGIQGNVGFPLALSICDDTGALSGGLTTCAIAR